VVGDHASKAAERRSKRIFLELPVRWLRRDGSVEAATGDLNAHGMFIRTDEPFELNSLHRIEVELPDGPIALHVVVKSVGRGVSGVGVGVEIHAVSESVMKRWVRHYEGVLAARGR
jgi:hypothetical protein